MVSHKVLVDTDVLIDFLRKKEKAKLWLESASLHSDLYCSVVTVAELLAGMKPAEEKATEELLEGFTILEVSEQIARRAGKLRRESGSRVLLPDCLIAATAFVEECPLMTFNQKDFSFKGLHLYS